MATKTETAHAGEFIASEASGRRSRDVGTVLSGTPAIRAGEVLGRVTVDTTDIVAAAFAGNAGGTGAMTLADPAFAAGVKAGVYRVTCIEPATNAGKFEVVDPDGVAVGIATAGVAFDGVIKFTIADGATDFVAGEGFTVTVAAGALKWTVCDPDASDGSQVAAGVLYEAVDASGGDISGVVVVVRDAEVTKSLLSFQDGVDAGEKTAAYKQLAAVGIIVR